MLSPDDKERIRHLFRTYSKLLNRHAMDQTGGDIEQSRDLVDEAFIEAGKRWDGLREKDDDKIVSWLRTTITRDAIDGGRRSAVAAKHQPSLERRAQRTADDPAEIVIAEDVKRRVRQVIANMPPVRRQVAELCWQKGMSPAEIAAVTGSNPSTVRSHLEAARDDIRAAIDPPEHRESNQPKGGGGQ